MIFHEIYGRYYGIVAKLIERAMEGNLTEKEMYQIVKANGFEESNMVIIPALLKQEWKLIDENMKTPIKEKPKTPMTLLEKRWIKTILSDPRMALFDIPELELEGVEPLFDARDVVYFDQYMDGDPYQDSLYRTHFRMMRNAIKEVIWMEIHYMNSKGTRRKAVILPTKIEYSDKEDKFRIIALGERENYTINMSRIQECEIAANQDRTPRGKMETARKVIFSLRDERNVLERAMMKFSHYKKEVERTGEDTYLVTLTYDASDETDILIQIMSFGMFIHVLEPDSIKENIKKRLERQLTMLQW